MNPGAASLLRLYMNADDRFERKPLYEAVVLKARELGLAGASVFSAEIGYGSHRVVHDAMSEYTFTGAPVVVEVVDSEEPIKALLAEFTAMVGEGLVTVSTVSPVHVARYVHPNESEERSDAD
jgi:PII-like signaling protein